MRQMSEAKTGDERLAKDALVAIMKEEKPNQKDYTNKELAILSKWSIIEPIDNYSEILKRFPQSVLSLIAMRAKTIGSLRYSEISFL